MAPEPAASGATYEAAGVSLAAGDEAVARIRSHVESTTRAEVIGGIGGFGAMFALDTEQYSRPVLVSSTDGIGTKAMVATMAGRFDTVGVDLVAMCVDDLVCQGAAPLFFLDYISIGRLDPHQVEQLVAGVAEGCRQAGCALVGGEVAEHPGAMADGEFDLVGFAVGVVERDAVLAREAVVAGDVLVGLASPGLRSNGYSLARHVLFDVAGRSLDDPAWDAPDAPSVADELLVPSVIYTPAVLRLIATVDVHGVAHITGGGMAGNVNRMLSRVTDAVIDRSSWHAPRIFDELARLGSISEAEMASVFNMGIGMVVALPPADVDSALSLLAGADRPATVIGEVVEGDGRVRFTR